MYKSLLQKILGAGAGAGLLLGAVPAHAVIIDSFDASNPSQSVTVTRPTTTGGNELDGLTNVIGGSRDIYIYNVTGTTGLNVQAQTTGGMLSIANGPNIDSTVRITWDGNDNNPNTVDTDGLGSIDLTASGELGIFLDLPFIDLNTSLSLTVWSNAGVNSSIFVRNYPVAVLNDFIPFTSFTGSANFNSVSAIMLEVNGPAGFDTLIDIIDTRAPTVPEPATLGLMGLGLAGVGFAHRRRQR